MILQFEADAVEIEKTESDVLVVGFYAEENYLMIQQSLDEFDEQDISLGMNTYHIERDDQSFGDYGGVEKIELSRNLIEVVLNETGKENLQCDGLKIGFETNNENYQMLIEKLTFIFGNTLIVKQN